VGSGGRQRLSGRHLTWVARAIRDGADVRGYFWRTFMDNHEWNHGMNTVRMGMYRVDKNDPLKQRGALPHSAVYGDIALRNQVPPEWQVRYPEPEIAKGGLPLAAAAPSFFVFVLSAAVLVLTQVLRRGRTEA
jgi:hypothetical protein